jgi:outer membrane murein-binding lipoprotein Lpp
METKVSLRLFAVISSMILLSLGCQKKNAATNSNSESKSELHDSTKPLQAVDLVGYNGTILRKSVNRIKETSDKHNQEIERTVESGPDQ